jgi:hypothetical protein
MATASSSSGFELDVFALANLVALDDVLALDLVAGVGIDLAVLDAVAGGLVELMEADLLPLGRRREKRDRAGNERELEVALPISTRCHGDSRTLRELKSDVIASVPLPLS